MSVNQVVIEGNLTRAPEVRTTKNGTDVCNFSVAVNNEFTRNNEKVKETTFVECEAWSFTAKNMEGLTTKSKVVVTGSLKSQVKGEGEKPTLLVKATSVSVIPYNGNGGSGGSSKPAKTQKPKEEELEVVGANSDDIPF